MNKTNKTKSKIKSRIVTKTQSLKRKLSRKCGRVKACWITAATLALFVVGCQNPAQRAQTLSFDNCQFTFTVNSAVPTNAVCAAPTFEIGTQAQANETAGNDAGMTASPTTDVRPDIDVTVPVNKANAGTSSASGALETVAGAAADWVSSKIKSTTSSSDSASTCTDGSCSDGSCSICVPTTTSE